MQHQDPHDNTGYRQVGAVITYEINKGVNRPIAFKGLKAQYIYYLAIGLAVLLLLFCALYIAGTPIYLGLVIILALGTGLFIGVNRMSRRFGTHGLKKLLDSRKRPVALRPALSGKNSRGAASGSLSAAARPATTALFRNLAKEA